MIKTNKAIKVLALLFALTLVLALSIFLGTALHSRAAVTERHVWLNADLGDDVFGGFDDPTAPFVSLEGALTAIQTECATYKSDEVKVIIHVDGDVYTRSGYDPTKTTQGTNNNFDGAKKVTGSDGGLIDIEIVGTPVDGVNPTLFVPLYNSGNSAFYLNNNYTFENVTIAMPRTGPLLYMNAGITDLVINQGTKIMYNGTENAALIATGITASSPFSGTRNITINDGTFRAVVAGVARNGTGSTAYTANITINGGTVTTVGYANYAAAGGYSGANSDITYNINGGTVGTLMTGQTNASGNKTYSGKVTVNMTGGTVTYFNGHGGPDNGGSASAVTTYADDVTVNITGGDITSYSGLKGLSKEATVISGNTTVNISGDVYIEKYIADPVSTVSATVTGAYNVTIGAGAHLNEKRPVVMDPVEFHAVVDGENGNDGTAQLESYDFPFRSLEGAIGALKAKSENYPASAVSAYVYVMSDAWTLQGYDASKNVQGNNNNFDGGKQVMGSDGALIAVEIVGVPTRGVNPTLSVPLYNTGNSAFYLNNNYIFENVTVKMPRSGPRFFMQGNSGSTPVTDLVINRGTKMMYGTTENVSLVATGITTNNTFSGVKNITVNDGTFAAVLAGVGRNGSGSGTYTANITINGGSITSTVGYANYAGSGYSGARSDITYNINGGRIGTLMTGQTNASGNKTYSGKVTVNMTGGTVTYFNGHGGPDNGGSASAVTTYADDVIINITGGDITSYSGLKGYSSAATKITGNTTVNISGDVYIEKYMADPVSEASATVTGDYNVTIGAGVHLNEARPVVIDPVEFHAVVDGVNGDDGTAELESYDLPFKTLEGALVALKAECAEYPSNLATAYVYVLSDANTLKASDSAVGTNNNRGFDAAVQVNGIDGVRCPVYVTGVPTNGVNPTLSTVAGKTQGQLYLNNNYIFENITIKNLVSSAVQLYMNTNVTDLVINKGTRIVSSSGAETSQLIATGITSTNPFSGVKNITVNDGTFGAVVAGLGRNGGSSSYTANITIGGGTITTVGYAPYAGGGYSGAKADITYTINGGKITNLMTGQTHANGNKTYSGKATINMTGGEVTNFQGHGGLDQNGSASVHTTYADDVTIKVTGGKITNFYGVRGVSAAGTTVSGKTDITISGNTEIGTFNGPNNATLSGEFNVTFSDNVKLTGTIGTYADTDAVSFVGLRGATLTAEGTVNYTFNGGDFSNANTMFGTLGTNVRSGVVTANINAGTFANVYLGHRQGGSGGNKIVANITGGEFANIYGGSVGGSTGMAQALADAQAGKIDYVYTTELTFGGAAHVTGNVYAQCGRTATVGGFPVKATFNGGTIDGNLYGSGEANTSTVNSNATYNVSTITLDGVTVGGDYVAGSASASNTNLLHANGTIRTIIKGNTVIGGNVILGNANQNAQAAGKFTLDLEGGTVGSIFASEGNSTVSNAKISTVSGNVNIKSGSVANDAKLALHVIPGEYELGLGSTASLVLDGLYNADLSENTSATLRLKEIETWGSGTAYLTLPNSYSAANVVSVPTMSAPLAFSDNGTEVIWSGAGASPFNGVVGNSLIMDDILSVRYFVDKAEVDSYIAQNGFWGYSATMDGTSFASVTFRSVSEAQKGMEVRTVGGKECYTFIVTGVPALSYDKQIRVAMTGAPVDSISVNDLLMMVIEGNFSNEFVQLAKALYNYGIATCNRFSEPSTLTPFDGVDYTKNYPSDYAVKNEGTQFSFYGTSLTFKDSIRMNYYGLLADGADLSEMQFTINGVAVPASELEITSVSGNGYNTRISFAINVREMAQHHELAILDANGAFVASINDSIAGACIYYIENNSPDASLASNILAYVEAAENYFASLA